jgi:DNA-binding response OmpR family regulator
MHMGDRPRSVKILVVDTDRRALRTLGDELLRADYDTIEAASFEDAKRLLAIERPSVLIAPVRLGEFNGLHLLLRGRMDQSDLIAIITSPVADSVLKAEAHRLGGSFLVEPVSPSEVLAIVSRSLPHEASQAVVPQSGPPRTAT